MKLACLFSGGKDSNFALYRAFREHEISCLINIKSKNPYSYMFQSVGNEFVPIQAEALGTPLLQYETEGEKEDELEDLKKAIELAKEKYKIDGVVTGAIKSAYQSARIQKICNELDLWCFNPLWQLDEKTFAEELISNGFEIKIIGVFSYPLTQKHLGRTFNSKLLEELLELNKKIDLSLVFEGGEAETFVVDGPLFKKRLEFSESEILMESEHAGVLEISRIREIEK